MRAAASREFRSAANLCTNKGQYAKKHDLTKAGGLGYPG